MHGSGGNETDGFRRAYILAYRSEATIRIERELGFTHSHNDEQDVLEEVGVERRDTRRPDHDMTLGPFDTVLWPNLVRRTAEEKAA